MNFIYLFLISILSSAFLFDNCIATPDVKVQIIKKNDKKVLQYLKNNLGKLETGTDGSLTLKKVYKITNQIISGNNYVVQGEFQQGNKDIHCNVIIWERLWLLKDQQLTISAKCDTGAKYA